MNFQKVETFITANRRSEDGDRRTRARKLIEMKNLSNYFESLVINVVSEMEQRIQLFVWSVCPLYSQWGCLKNCIILRVKRCIWFIGTVGLLLFYLWCRHVFSTFFIIFHQLKRIKICEQRAAETVDILFF